MGKALFDRATSKYVGTFVHNQSLDIPHDSGTHIVIIVVGEPDARLNYWDGADGVRPATVQELDAHDDFIHERSALGQVNTPYHRALREVLWDLEKRLRAAGHISSIEVIEDSLNSGMYGAAITQLVVANR